MRSILPVEPVVRGAFALPAPLDASVVTLGAFDGVHRGHQALISRAVTLAKARGIPAVAYTFDPHPAKVLAPKMAPPTICSLSERVRLLLSLGIDQVVAEPFDAAFSQITADEWASRYLVGQLHPAHVVVGFNFTYGKDRGGDAEHLRTTGAEYAFSVEIVEPVVLNGIVASSTRVREFLLEGNLQGAELLLGRRYAVTGKVVEGDRRGRTIGFPTANVEPDHELIPAHGVYATRIDVGDGVLRDSVTNVGKRPTFSGTHVTVETYVFDWTEDLYGKRVRIEMVERLRDERRFDGIDALVAQLNRDVEDARRVLGST